MKKSKLYLIISLLLSILILYFFSSYKNSYVANIISTVEEIIIVIAMIYTYKKINFFKVNWLILSMAAFSCLISDSIWAYYSDVLNINLVNNNFILYFDLIPNFCILLSIFLFFIKQKNKWNSVQLFLDISTFIIMTCFIAWKIFFSNYFNILGGITQASIVNIVYIITDFLAFSMIMVILISSEYARRSISFKIISLGIIVFTLGDLIFSYQSLNNLYIQNNISDFTYMISLVVFSISGLYELYMPNENMDKIVHSDIEKNIRSSKLSLILLIFPFSLWFFNLIDIKNVVFLTAVILLNNIASIYINIYYKNSILIKEKSKQNEFLERIVLEKTKELRTLNNSLEDMVKKDVLTNLVSRRFFIDELDRIMAEITEGKTIAVFFIDLDRFKAINDSYGHEMGDLVLIEVAKRIKNVFSEDSIAARLGGDEFVIAVSNLSSQEAIASLAEKLVNAFNKLVIVDPYEFKITLSIGISIFPTDAEDRVTLMKNCDIAMYRAKEMGFNKYKFFDKEMNKSLIEKLKIELMLRSAIYCKEFELYYQPQIDIINNKLIGAEALLRWNAPDGMIFPDKFIPIAEEIGVIVPLGQWVLREALKQIKIWNEKYGLELSVSVNISPKQFDSLNFIDNVKNIISRLGTPSKWIDIEITEACAMNNETVTEKKVKELNDFGVKISIDDFGTGYSSFGYLKRFSVDRLKIDKQLIDTIAIEPNGYQIVNAIIVMAKALELKVIAEGVETKEQLHKLKELQCDEVQGYYFSKPVNASDFEKYIECNR